MTQTEAIRQYVKKNGSITTMEAFQHLGITRLAARIADLTREGYTVKRTPIEYTTPLGASVRIMRYSNIRKRRDEK